jgi:hypothetical protein
MTTPRGVRTYLKFVSSVYQLAAEVEPSELAFLRREALRHRQRAVAAIAEALAALSSNPKGVSNADAPQEGSNREDAGRDAIRSTVALSEALRSKKLFPSNDDVAKTLAPTVRLEPRNKESREKLVRRAMASLSRLTVEQRDNVVRSIQQVVARSGDSDFVSRWSRLIRSL